MTKGADKFLVYLEEFDILKSVSNEEMGMFIRALIEFVRTGEVPVLDEKLEFAFRFITAHIERDQKKYREMTAKRSIAGKKGQEAKRKIREENSFIKEESQYEMCGDDFVEEKSLDGDFCTKSQNEKCGQTSQNENICGTISQNEKCGKGSQNEKVCGKASQNEIKNKAGSSCRDNHKTASSHSEKNENEISKASLAEVIKQTVQETLTTVVKESIKESVKEMAKETMFDGEKEKINKKRKKDSTIGEEMGVCGKDSTIGEEKGVCGKDSTIGEEKGICGKDSTMGEEKGVCGKESLFGETFDIENKSVTDKRLELENKSVIDKRLESEIKSASGGVVVDENKRFTEGRNNVAKEIENLPRRSARETLDYIIESKNITTPADKDSSKRKETVGVEEKFEEFWECYPKKEDKISARKAFFALNPTDKEFSSIMQELKKHKQTQEWIRENGRFVPRPSKWISCKRWEDKIEASPYKVESTPHKNETTPKIYGFYEDSFEVEDFFNAALKKSQRDWNKN